MLFLQIGMIAIYKNNTQVGKKTKNKLSFNSLPLLSKGSGI